MNRAALTLLVSGVTYLLVLRLFANDALATIRQFLRSAVARRLAVAGAPREPRAGQIPGGLAAHPHPGPRLWGAAAISAARTGPAPRPPWRADRISDLLPAALSRPGEHAQEPAGSNGQTRSIDSVDCHRRRASVARGGRRLAANGLEILLCDDLRSFKKIIPVLERWPDSFVLTADDDLYYPPDWLQTIVAGFSPARPAIVCRRAHLPARAADGRLAPYGEWQHEIDMRDDPSPRHGLFPTGIGGVLYYPGSLAPEVTNREAFLRLCPRADDVWLYWMGRRAGTRYRQVGGPSRRSAGRGPNACRCGSTTWWRATTIGKSAPSRITMASLDQTDLHGLVLRRYPATLDYKPDGAEENRGVALRPSGGSRSDDFWRRRKWSSSTRIPPFRRPITSTSVADSSTFACCETPVIHKPPATTIADGPRPCWSAWSTRWPTTWTTSCTSSRTRWCFGTGSSTASRTHCAATASCSAAAAGRRGRCSRACSRSARTATEPSCRGCIKSRRRTAS